MINEERYWNNDASNYDKRAQKSHEAYLKIISLIKKDITNEMNILDIGTGTGEIPLSISNDVKSIHAIDFSSEMIQIAENKAEKRRIENITFLVQDGNTLNYEDNSFDVITIINLLHIVSKPGKIISEAKRLIKNDGKIIIATYLHDENIRSKVISYFMKMKGHPVVTMYNSKTICEYIEGSLLKIIYSENIPNIMPILYITAVKK